MSVDRGDDEVRDAFRQAYQVVTDQIPASTEEWPLLPAVAFLERPTEHRWRGVTVAVSFLLLAAAFFSGQFFAGESDVAATGLLAAQDEESAEARAVQDGLGYRSPSDAAIAAALVFEPGLGDLRVTNAVVIFADETTVDLRVEVKADEFCHWFGVVGRIEAGVLVWRGGPALGCEG